MSVAFSLSQFSCQVQCGIFVVGVMSIPGTHSPCTACESNSIPGRARLTPWNVYIFYDRYLLVPMPLGRLILPLACCSKIVRQVPPTRMLISTHLDMMAFLRACDDLWYRYLQGRLHLCPYTRKMKLCAHAPDSRFPLQVLLRQQISY